VEESELRLRAAVARLLEAGFQISPITLQMLRSQQDPDDVVNRFLAQNKLQPLRASILEPHHFASHDPIGPGEQIQSEDVGLVLPLTKQQETVAVHQQLEPQLEVRSDPTPELASQGTLEEFVANFRDRYRRLRQIITQRVDGKGVVDISSLSGEAGKRTDERSSTAKIVGLVGRKAQTKTGNLILELEDLTGRASVVVQQKEEALMKKTASVLLDQVICVEGMPVSPEMVIAKDLFLPDVPATRHVAKAKEDVSVVLISDIHYGSKQFLEPVFKRFLHWLQGREGDEEQVGLAATVKYLVIAGDLVDGIGVYPNQLEDILIHDYYDQYAGLAKLLQGVPDYIHVIITPGNHDAVRNAIPRPAVDPTFLEPFKEAGFSMTSLGCPCQLSLHGVDLLVYHGDSLIDMMGALSKPELEAGFVAMRELLRGRHLAPIYGKSTTIAPERRDWLVIDHVPDILHCGHIHVNSAGSYRKTLIVNSGTFQSQTEYQRSIGIEPTPGIVPLVNLHTLSVKTLTFA
jgi:DNA polymerase II small subunit